MHDGSMHSDCKVLGVLFGLQLPSPELVGTRSRNQLQEIRVRRGLYEARREASRELGSEVCCPGCAFFSHAHSSVVVSLFLLLRPDRSSPAHSAAPLLPSPWLQCCPTHSVSGSLTPDFFETDCPRICQVSIHPKGVRRVGRPRNRSPGLNIAA